MLKKPKRVVNKKLIEKYREEPCEACGKEPSDPAHIISRGAGGGDVESNLIPLCRLHHAAQHKMGWKRFADLFFSVWCCLSNKGFEFDENGRLRKE